MEISLESHFNWNLESEVLKIDRNRTKEKLLARIESDAKLKGKTHLLLSYLYAKNDVTGLMDLNKALEYTDGVMTSPDFSAGEKWLAKVNKSCILRELMQDEESLRLREEARTEFINLPDREKAKIFMCKVFAYWRLKTRAHDDIIACCDEVLRYNHEDGEAFLFKARALTRKNTTEGMGEEEERSYDLAIQFWPDSPLPLVNKAHALLDTIKYRSSPIGRHDSRLVFQEVDDLVKRGKQIAVAKRHGHALKECAAIDGQTLYLMFRVDRSQALNNIDRLTDRQKDSIEKAEEISPNDTHIKREHARFYACNRKYKNTTRATALYEEAVRCAINDPERRLTARIDLINHTAIQSKDYQLKLQQLRDMIPDFETPEHKIDIRDQIARCYMNKFQDFQQAYDVIEATLVQFPTTRARSSAKTI